MNLSRHDSGLVIAEREEVAAYILDMVGQLAQLARGVGDQSTAIHLEAIIAAQRAASETPQP